MYKYDKMTELNIFKQKEQVAYIPLHAKGNINHPDVQFGFVVRDAGHIVFCRYWNRESLAAYARRTGLPELRTKSTSEPTVYEVLVRDEVCDQKFVEDAWNKYVEPLLEQ